MSLQKFPPMPTFEETKERFKDFFKLFLFFFCKVIITKKLVNAISH